MTSNYMYAFPNKTYFCWLIEMSFILEDRFLSTAQAMNLWLNLYMFFKSLGIILHGHL